MSELFHAYVIEGNKEDAKAHIVSLLGTRELFPPENIDSIVTEHVHFSIDDARALKEWQMLSATHPDGKMCVAFADFISIEAQNALLKTFEEPVAHTHIMLVVPNTEAILPTLLSRVVVLKTNKTLISTEEAKTFLTYSTSERIAYVGKLCEKSDDDDASAIVRKNAIHFLDALEVVLATDAVKNSEIIKKIIDSKRYLQISGASVKMILESIALAV